MSSHRPTIKALKISRITSSGYVLIYPFYSFRPPPDEFIISIISYVSLDLHLTEAHMHSFVHGGVFGSVIAMCTGGGCSFHDPPHKYRRFRLDGASYRMGESAEAGIAGRNVCILTRVLEYHVF